MALWYFEGQGRLKSTPHLLPRPRKQRNAEAVHLGEVKSCLMPWEPQPPRATHRSQVVILCLLDANCSSYRTRQSRATCWGTQNWEGTGGTQTPSLVPTEMNGPMSSGAESRPSPPAPQQWYLSYQLHSHNLLHPSLGQLGCLHPLPPVTDTTEFLGCDK